MSALALVYLCVFSAKWAHTHDETERRSHREQYTSAHDSFTRSTRASYLILQCGTQAATLFNGDADRPGSSCGYTAVCGENLMLWYSRRQWPATRELCSPVTSEIERGTQEQAACTHAECITRLFTSCGRAPICVPFGVCVEYELAHFATHKHTHFCQNDGVCVRSDCVRFDVFACMCVVLANAAGCCS